MDISSMVGMVRKKKKNAGVSTGMPVVPGTSNGRTSVPGDAHMSEMGASMRLGGGGRFKALASKLDRQPGITNPRALAASIGRKKYGKRRFQRLAAQGT
jgi:hypothetical protein